MALSIRGSHGVGSTEPAQIHARCAHQLSPRTARSLKSPQSTVPQAHLVPDGSPQDLGDRREPSPPPWRATIPSAHTDFIGTRVRCLRGRAMPGWRLLPGLDGWRPASRRCVPAPPHPPESAQFVGGASGADDRTEQSRLGDRVDRRPLCIISQPPHRRPGMERDPPERASDLVTPWQPVRDSNPCRHLERVVS
jgi:hypothetical protein